VAFSPLCHTVSNDVAGCQALLSDTFPQACLTLSKRHFALVESPISGTKFSEEFIFFNGKRVARRDVASPSAVHYYFSDHLGSADTITDASGAIQKQSDYFPFGGEVVVSGSDANNYKFTGKERDTETGLDEFGARYYSSPFGRFMQADWAAKPTSVPYANFGNPQSLNLYSYVQNNPTMVGDPDGHDALWITDTKTGQKTLVIPVHITGKSVTPDIISTITNRDNRLNTGGSAAKILVIETDKPINGVLNHMDYSPGYDKKYDPAGEGVNRLGGNRGHINSDNNYSTDAVAHDILHFAGIDDAYIEGKPDNHGNRTSTPKPGYDDSNIMTSRLGANLKPEQIQHGSENKSTKHITTDKITVGAPEKAPQ
jgi:RHS repeat-associated protein